MTARTKEALCCDFRAHDFVGRWVSLSFLSQKLVVFLPKHSIAFHLACSVALRLQASDCISLSLFLKVVPILGQPSGPFTTCCNRACLPSSALRSRLCLHVAHNRCSVYGASYMLAESPCRSSTCALFAFAFKFYWFTNSFNFRAW